ncbi:UPF0329 protein [Raphanus sativus]|nr:UPF0329 protein [Raphanus sativus]
MKTVTGSVNSAKPISLAKAATLLSGFVSSETQASQDVSAYLRRASAGFAELKSVHREIRSANPKEELGGAKGVDDDKKKKEEEEVVEEMVMVKLEDEQRNKERKKKKKSKKEDGIDENLEEEQRNEERKEKKNRKSKKKRKSKESDDA